MRIVAPFFGLSRRTTFSAAMSFFLLVGNLAGQPGTPKSADPKEPATDYPVLVRINAAPLTELKVATSGKLLAFAGKGPKEKEASRIFVWDIKLQKQLPMLSGHAGGVTHLVVSEPARRVASAGHDNSVRLWNVDTGEKIAEFESAEPISDLGMSTDGQSIAVGSKDKIVRIWDLETKRDRHRLEGHGDGDLKLDLRASRLLTASAAEKGKDFDLRFWNAKDGRQIQRLKGHTAAVTGVALSPDARMAVSASRDGTVRLWETESGKELRRLVGHGDARSVEFPMPGFAVTVGGGSVRLWDIAKARTLAEIPNPAAPASPKAVALESASYFGPGQLFAAGGDMVYLWDLRAAIDQQQGVFPDIVTTLQRGDGGRTPVALGIPTEPANVPPGTELSTLFRELVRQSLLLAAREELGLQTRDALLGEAGPDPSPPGGKGPLDFTMNWSPAGYRLEILDRTWGGPPKTLWSFRNPTNGHSVESLTIMMERLSREQMPAALQKAGYPALAGKRKWTNDPVPDEAKKRLEEMTFTSQFAALREIHATIAAKGESRDLVGGLIRAYANLGLLTEINWSPAHKAFKARALLYAERLVARFPKAASSHWLKAYASGIAGVHIESLTELETAKKAKRDIEPPAWVEIVDAYCRFRTDRLTEIANEAGNNAELAGLLRILSMEWVVPQNELLMAGMEYVDAHPECYRLIDVVGANGAAQLGRYGWERAEQMLTRTIRDRLSEMPKLPKKVSDLLASSPADPKIGEPPLIQALRDARFDGEASWGMLAELIQQTRFLHAYRYSEYMWVRKFSAPDPKVVADKTPLVGNHPFLPLLAHLVVRTPDDREAILKVVKQMRLSETSLAVVGRFLNAVNKLQDADRLTPMYRRMHGHTDLTYFDLLGPVMFAKGEDLKYLDRLLVVCPYSPNGRARAIALAWDRYEKKIEDWQNDGHSVVLVALAKHYADAKEDERAIEFYQAALRKGADRPTYLELADLYERRKDEPKWLETLLDSLKLDRGVLDWANTHHKIAHHYMRAREWEKALPYAEKAASTKSGGGMIAAGRCHLALEHFDQSEELFAMTSTRYPEDCFEWYTWCKLTGRGGIDEARELVEKQLKAEGDRVTQAKGVRNAIYYLLSNQNLEAVKLLNRILVKSNDERVRMYYFVAADRTGVAEAREQAVKSFANQPGERAAVLRLVGESGPGVPLDLRKINATLAQMPPGPKSETAMVVGLFLLQHNQPKAAIPYLRQPPGTDINMFDAIAASAPREAEAKAAKK